MEDDDDRIQAELDAVIEIMRLDYPAIADYNVTEDEVVQILDEHDNVLATITTDQLTGYWNNL